MTTRRDVEAVLDEFLGEGSNTVPDLVIEATLAEISHTGQTSAWHLPWWPQRLDRRLRLAVAVGGLAAAVFASHYVAGPAWLPSMGGPGATASPSPTPTASPPPAPSPSPSPTLVQVTGATFDLPFTVHIPSDWTVDARSDIFSAFRPAGGDPRVPAAGIDLILVSNVYRDPCDPGAGMLDPPIGSQVADLTGFLFGIEAMNASGPEPVTISGSTGVAFNEDFRPSASCDRLALWETTREPYLVYGDEPKRFMVVDIGGQRVVVVIVATKSAWEDAVVEGQAILGTLRFEGEGSP
jgi:hypothetical protein